MSTSTTERTYTIKEASALTGLPASTLRYYESVGVIAPVGRGDTSGHRVYSEADMDLLTWVACLSATGMSISDMRKYVENGALGPDAAAAQIRLLQEQQKSLVIEAEHVAVRQRYVALKIDYWRAVEEGDDDRVEILAAEAKNLSSQLKAGRARS